MTSLASTKRQRVSSNPGSSPQAFPAHEWEVPKLAAGAGAGSSGKSPSSPPREKRRTLVRAASSMSSDSEGITEVEIFERKGSQMLKGKQEKGAAKEDKSDKMTGLALPDVVRELLKDAHILRWDVRDGVYEVVNGDLFEKRFNELRKVRNKVKPSGTERPFSRMYNFFLLEQGDKWARTGTRFRPRVSSGFPSAEFLASIKAAENKKQMSAGSRSRAATTAPTTTVVPPRAPAMKLEPHTPALSGGRSPATPSTVAKVQEQRPRMSAGTGAIRVQKSPVIRAANPKPMPVPREPEDLALDGARHHMVAEHSMLGKRPREMMPHDRILPREMIEAAARKLRLLEEEHEMAHSYREHEVYHAARHEEHEPVHHHHQAHHHHHHHHHRAYERATVHQMEHHGGVSGFSAPPARYSAQPAGFHQMPPLPPPSYDVHDDLSDGMSSCMSSCVPSPETMMSLVGDFAGSPLDLGESELSSLLADSPGNSKLEAHKEHHTSFLFDAIDDSASWVVDW